MTHQLVTCIQNVHFESSRPSQHSSKGASLCYGYKITFPGHSHICWCKFKLYFFTLVKNKFVAVNVYSNFQFFFHMCNFFSWVAHNSMKFLLDAQRNFTLLRQIHASKKPSMLTWCRCVNHVVHHFLLVLGNNLWWRYINLYLIVLVESLGLHFKIMTT